MGHMADAKWLWSWIKVAPSMAVAVASDQIGDLCKCSIFLVLHMNVTVVTFTQSSVRAVQSWQQNAGWSVVQHRNFLTQVTKNEQRHLNI